MLRLPSTVKWGVICFCLFDLIILFLLVLFDTSFIECLAVLGSILQVLLVSFGEIMRSAEIFLCAHIEIVVMHMIEHGINASNARDANRAWRKTGILIGVVWTVDMQEIVVDSLELKLLPCELDGWIGLQRHTVRVLGIDRKSVV